MSGTPKRIAAVEALIGRVRAFDPERPDDADLALAEWLYTAPGSPVTYDPALYLIRHDGWVHSVDAALALAEWVLPNWSPQICMTPAFCRQPPSRLWSVEIIGPESREVVWGHDEPPEMAFDTARAEADTAPLAILLATLTAHLAILKGQEAANADD